MSTSPNQYQTENENNPQERRRLLILQEEALRNQKKELELREQEIKSRNLRNKLIATIIIVGLLSVAIIIAAIAAIALLNDNEQSTNLEGQLQKTNDVVNLTLQALSSTSANLAINPTSTIMPEYQATPIDVAPVIIPSDTPLPLPTNTIQPVNPNFFDNFDNGFVDQWRTEEGTWIVVNGEAVPQERASNIVVVGEPYWDNFALDLDFTLPVEEFSSDGNLEVLLGYVDIDNYVVLELETFDNYEGYMSLYLIDKGSRYDFMDTIYDAFSAEGRRHLRVEVRSKKLDVFIDNQLVTSVVLSESVQGAVGLDASIVGQPTVDNFLISPLP